MEDFSAEDVSLAASCTLERDCINAWTRSASFTPGPQGKAKEMRGRNSSRFEGCKERIHARAADGGKRS